ncbi:hypothetical protein VINI7043_21326 [Vibrio nigripulchritudo ATCC 27043]|uniref:hypothetical protein n=1 Tax=Vibrio TaxID=662 RepID=UPI00021C1B3B|nr:MULTISPECIES: hypothetical protein [Vibrio]EGU61711.1 hypothetical protein VINI7043_21326 [Vibrio nigripulchritudo ATCC 27043]KJY75229.1 hypothetical protein TW74_18015 [Vibrio nigripulchritudo]UAB72675.1 hypothetical protein INR79_25805 [Vibrio sp. SCSIO 43132]BCL72998.1 hypothetical protein VNTUMSATTG_49350 [Vibrio nigripulchritudo]BDU34362.1 hypothetical protein TUMSATVNIG1_49710 [Vibrio nigripulchritudo]
MDLKGLEKYLALNYIDYKPSTGDGGLLINLGFLVGRVHVKYDSASNTFDFNDKPRWIIQIMLLLMMLYFLISNFHVYSPLQLNMCIGVTVMMVGIFGYKESRIMRLKKAVSNQES